jgi:outer membrane protein
MSNLSLKHAILLIPASCFFAHSSFAEENSFSLGLGAGFSASEYKDYDGGTSFVPLINYDSDFFFIHAYTAGAYLYRDQYNALQLAVSYYSHEFDPADTDNNQLKLLDSRYTTAMGGLNYIFSSPLGNFSTSIAGDLLDETDGGMLISAQYQYPMLLTQQVMAIPGIGATYTNADLNDYYYGISASESSRSGLAEYSPSSSITPYMGLTLKFNLSPAFDAFVSSRYQILPDEIKDSPMVDSDYKIQTTAGVSFRF